MLSEVDSIIVICSLAAWVYDNSVHSSAVIYLLPSRSSAFSFFLNRVIGITVLIIKFNTN